MSELGERIKAKRERDGLSLREAGEQSGVAFSTLGRIENGANPSVGVYHRLTAWLEGVGATLPPPPMTLRDWFAGQALAGLLASGATYGGKTDNRAALSDDAYATADAMMAARSPEPHKEA